MNISELKSIVLLYMGGVFHRNKKDDEEYKVNLKYVQREKKSKKEQAIKLFSFKNKLYSHGK